MIKPFFPQDEIIQVPNPPVSVDSPEISAKRSLDKPHSKSQAKRAWTRSISPQNVIPSYLESRREVPDPPDRVEVVNPPAILYLKDNKTRRYRTIPPHHDTLSGRLQLMLYRRLLSQLVAKSPLYDFSPLWRRLGVKSSSQFPTKFLVQANLISDDTDFQTTCLDDLVTSWHRLVEKANIQSIDENLELVYRLRPPPDRKQKRRAIFSLPEVDDCTAKDIAASQIDALTRVENSTAGPSNYLGDSATIAEGLEASVSDLEDAQLQWALQQSMMPQSDQEGEFPGM